MAAPAPIARPEGPEALAAIHAGCFTTPPPWDSAAIARVLAMPGCFLLTESASFLIGRAVLDEAELLTLAVLPEARRRGLATRLTGEFAARASALGARRAFLEVADDNAPAQALYRRLGWEIAGRRPRYYRRPDGSVCDALIMALTLRQAEETG